MFHWFAKAKPFIKSNGIKCSTLSLINYRMSKGIKYLELLGNLLTYKVSSHSKISSTVSIVSIMSSEAKTILVCRLFSEATICSIREYKAFKMLT